MALCPGSYSPPYDNSNAAEHRRESRSDRREAKRRPPKRRQSRRDRREIAKRARLDIIQGERGEHGNYGASHGVRHSRARLMKQPRPPATSCREPVSWRLVWQRAACGLASSLPPPFCGRQVEPWPRGSVTYPTSAPGSLQAHGSALPRASRRAPLVFGLHAMAARAPGRLAALRRPAVRLFVRHHSAMSRPPSPMHSLSSFRAAGWLWARRRRHSRRCPLSQPVPLCQPRP